MNQNPWDSQMFASTVIVTVGAVGIGLLFYAPLLGLGLFGMAAAVACRLLTRN